MKSRLLGLSALALAVCFSARATTITFTAASLDPNTTATANTSAYGSTANVSVGYSPYTTIDKRGRYGTIAGTGIAIYSDDDDDIQRVTFEAAPGYTVTLDSFDLASYRGRTYPTDISVTGGNTAYTMLGSRPSAATYTTYSPGVTGTSLTLNITDIGDVGLNDITFHESAVAATPEPSSIAFLLTGAASLAGLRSRFRRNS